MIVKFFKNGNTKNKSFSTGGNGVKDYLLNERVENGTAKLLQGDPNETTEIINGLGYSTIYTAGCLSFDKDESERVTQPLKETLMNDFERALFGDFDKSRISGYWVEHTDKDRLELNFVFASVDLQTGKALPVYFHQNDKHRINDFKDLANLTYDLSDPNAPEHKATTSISNRLPTDKKELKQAINDYLTQRATAYNSDLKTHDDIKKALVNDLGLEITRTTKTAISIKDPNNGKQPIRLTGVFYEQQYQLDNVINQSQNQQTATDRAERISELSQRLETSISKRTQQLQERYKPRPKQNNRQSKARNSADNDSLQRPKPTPPGADQTARGNNQQTAKPNSYTYKQSPRPPAPYDRQLDRSKRKPKPTNDSRPPQLAKGVNQRLSENELSTTTINDFHNPHASGRTSHNANNRNQIERMGNDWMDKPSVDNHSNYSLGDIPNSDEQIRGRLNELNYANDTNNVKSSIKQFTDTAKQFFETVTDSAKSSYQRLSDTTSKITESFRKYANQHTEQHRAVVSAVGTATETNKQLRELTDSAERTNRELKQTSYRTKQANNYLSEAIDTKRAEQLRQEQKQKQAELIKQQTPKPQKPQAEPTKPKSEPPKQKFRM